MFRPLRHAIRLIVVAAGTWAALVYGLPVVRSALPRFCTRWSLQGGFCAQNLQERLARADVWIQRVLRPLPQHARVQRAVIEVSATFARLEALVREQVGDEHVDDALRGTDVALRRLEAVVGEGGDAREKLAAVPGNAQELLSRARDAFERLRAVLGTSSRRAEEVSGALEETKDALDALSSVLPHKE